jgi:hypothetical protein
MATRNRTIGYEATVSNVDFYTVPPRFVASVDSIVVSNASAATVTFSLDWYDSTTSTYYTIAEQVEMPGNSILQLSDCFMLQSSDKLRGLASVGSAITFSIRVQEEYSAVL